MDEKTPGERTFERYLQGQGLPFDYEKAFPLKAKHPDYAVPYEGRELLFEVKDIVRDLPGPGFSAFDPYAPIRAEIDEAREKFKEFKGECCALVLHLVRGLTHFDGETILGAMHGDLGFQFLFDKTKGQLVRDSMQEVFIDRGQMTRPHWQIPHNTTISAVVALRGIRIGVLRFAHEYLAQFDEGTFIHHLGDDVPYDKEEIGLGVVVAENKDAVAPLPRTIFTGHFDERWAQTDDGSFRRIFAGDGVLERDRLEELAKKNARPAAT